MTNDRLPGDGMGGIGEPDDRVDDGGPDISVADGQALTALFAALVADAPASEISPLAIIKLGRIDRRLALDTRIKRFKIIRNVLVAAAFAALVVLIVPHLGARSSESAAVSGSSSTAAAVAPFVASAAPALAPAAAPQPAGSAAAASGAASKDTRKTLSTAGAAGSASAPSAVGVRCPPLPAGLLAAVRSAFPGENFGPATTATDCAGSGADLPVARSVLTVSARPGATLVVTVVRAGAGACVPTGCVRRESPGADAYAAPAGSSVWVYGNGYQVMLETTGKFATPLGVDRLVAAGRAVITALG